MSTQAVGWVGAELAGGRYRVVGKLGEGGMGFVYRAWDANLDTDVVIKVPRRAMLDEPGFAERFSREIRSLVRLSHPHIVKALDVGVHDGLPFAVLQFLSGGSLDDRRPPASLGPQRRMAPGSLRDWLAAVAAALDFIHVQQYVHRDVKPANILFDTHGHSFLSDFGVAKVIAARSERDHNNSLTGTGLVLGTPHYMAPELVMGQAFDGRVDQYALAVTVHELLAGHPPIDGTGPTAILVQQTLQPPPALHTIVPGIPEALSMVVLKALSKDQRQRYPTCTQFAEEVLAAVRHLSFASAPPVPARPPGRVSRGARGNVSCPTCQTVLQLTEDLRNRHAACPMCQTPIFVSDDLCQLTEMSNAADNGQQGSSRGTVAQQSGGAITETAGIPSSPAGTALKSRPRRKQKTKQTQNLVASGVICSVLLGGIAIVFALLGPSRPPPHAAASSSTTATASTITAPTRPPPSPSDRKKPAVDAGPASSPPSLPPTLVTDLSLERIENIIVDGSVPIKWPMQRQATVKEPEQFHGLLRYELAGGPKGMTCDPDSGMITWLPLGKLQAGASTITVTVSLRSPPKHSAKTTFELRIEAPRITISLTPKKPMVGNTLSVEIGTDPRDDKFQLEYHDEQGNWQPIKGGKIQFEGKDLPMRTLGIEVRGKDSRDLFADLSTVEPVTVSCPEHNGKGVNIWIKEFKDNAQNYYSEQDRDKLDKEKAAVPAIISAGGKQESQVSVVYLLLEEFVNNKSNDELPSEWSKAFKSDGQAEPRKLNRNIYDGTRPADAIEAFASGNVAVANQRDVLKKLGGSPPIGWNDIPRKGDLFLRLLEEIGATAITNVSQWLDDPERRGGVLVILSKLGRPAIPPLLDALKQHREPGVQRGVIWALACAMHQAGDATEDATVAAAFRDALADPDLDVQRFAVHALVGLGPRAGESVKDALSYLEEMLALRELPEVAGRAASLLGVLGTRKGATPKAIKALAKALEDNHNLKVRAEVIKSLKAIGPKADPNAKEEAVSALKKFAEDPKNGQAISARQAIEFIQSGEPGKP